MGELQIVFAFLKCIGKFIDNSGLDEIFVESGIHGPQTLEQRKGGKHRKRSFEAYLTLYIALYELDLEELASFYPEIENLRNASNQIAKKSRIVEIQTEKKLKKGMSSKCFIKLRTSTFYRNRKVLTVAYETNQNFYATL